MQNQLLVVLCTCPDKTCAEQLSTSLVQAKLAACTNIINPISSIFAWQGKIDMEQESLLLIKTTRNAYPALEKAIIQQHPYEIPEIIAIPIEQGAANYLNWVRDNTCAN